MTLLQSIVPALGRATRLESNAARQPSEPRVKPVFTLKEDTNSFQATVELPGVAKEGLEITAQEGDITVVGRRAWSPPADWTTLYRETPRAHYELNLRHGSEVDASKINAELKNGVLRINLPKADAAKPRKITVS